ncbi:hypothetical protein D9615_002029 [Tricholomella constricta]|uniref:Uncharacterized protein n=1 Tax=Tricholomella constricta TaxID=117010 RepID=A0A8H5HP73_9AGAR|nr:hypothetical protein D9615_002029 [Tricholomella constricta]
MSIYSRHAEKKAPRNNDSFAVLRSFICCLCSPTSCTKMPLLHVLGLRKCLVLALVILAAQALELSLTPTNITPGEKCQVNVTANGTDPEFIRFNLGAYCPPDLFTWRSFEDGIELKKANRSFSQEYNIMEKVTDLVPPTTCRVEACVTGDTPTNVSAIVGGVVGGVSALTLIVALLYVCHRHRGRLYLAKRLEVLRTDKPKASAFNGVTSEKDSWSVQVDGAITEAARQTERAQSRTENNQKPLDGPNSHYYSDGYQSPDLMEAKAQQADFQYIAMTTSTTSHADEEWESPGHNYDGGYSTLASETGEGSDPESGVGPWGHPDSLDDFERQSNASSIPDINEMDPEAREKRRDVILERMRKVLDGEPQGPGFVVL